ncbi:MAG: hypothetical protein WAW96_03375 [Alphaproteobacteria bacterium]
MKLDRIAISIVSLAVLSACATPQSTPAASTAAIAATPAPNSASAKDTNRVICKTLPVTGSRLGGTKTCMTGREWDEYEYRQMKNTQGYQNSQPGPPTPGHP